MRRIICVASVLFCAGVLVTHVCCTADQAGKVQKDAQWVANAATNPVVEGAASAAPGGGAIVAIVGTIAGAVAGVAGAVGAVYQSKQKNDAHNAVAEITADVKQWAEPNVPFTAKTQSIINAVTDGASVVSAGLAASGSGQQTAAG